MLSQEEILRAFLPSWLFDYFELEKLTSSEEKLDVYLELLLLFGQTKMINLAKNKLHYVQIEKYSKEFKLDALNLLQEGKSISEISRNLGISVNTLCTWRRRYKLD